MSQRFHVAVLGATGGAGRELISVLEESNFPVEKLTLFSGAKAEGERLEFQEEEIVARAVTPDRLKGVQIVLNAAPAAVVREWAPVITKAGALLVDPTGAFRADLDVPVVIPGVNPDAVLQGKARKILSAAASATHPIASALAPLHREANVLRVVLSTYQSVSGAGQKGIRELEQQTSNLMSSREAEIEVFAHRVAFNLVPQIGVFQDDGSTDEEARVVSEIRRLLGVADLRVSATAVRVPVFFGHAASVNVTTEKKLTADQARALLRKVPGLKVIDDPAQGLYPMPMLAAGDVDVHVGRIREDRSQQTGLDLFVCVDDVKAGAAAVVQLARLAIQHALV